MKYKSSKLRIKKPSAGFIMVLPGYIIFFVFEFVALFITIILSFTNYNLYDKMDFVGLSNYVRMVSDEVLHISIKNTFFFSVGTVLPLLIFGLITAVLLNDKIVGRNFFRISFYIPHVTSMAAVSMVWLWMYNSNGFINELLKTIGLSPVRWLFDMNTALLSIIIMNWWQSIGYVMIIYLAALQQIPSTLYEASRIDGASSIRRFFAITVPMVKPTTFFLLVTITIKSFNVFGQVMIMTEGGPLYATTTIIHQMYQHAFYDFKMGYASAISILLLAILILITIVNFGYGKKGQDLEVG